MLLHEGLDGAGGLLDHRGIALDLKEEGVADRVGVIDETGVVDGMHHLVRGKTMLKEGGKRAKQH